MSKNLKYFLLIFSFLVNFIQWIIIFRVPYGGMYIFTHFSNPFIAVINKPELSNLSDIKISSINYLVFLLYFGGIASGIIIPFFYKINLAKRLFLNIYATVIPLLLIASLLIFFPTPDVFIRNSSNGFQWEKYEWHRKKGDFIKLWRSEKCDTCYRQNERVKWILIKKGYEKE